MPWAIILRPLAGLRGLGTLALGFLLFTLIGHNAARGANSGDESGRRTWPGADLFADDTVNQIQIEISTTDLEQLGKEAREFVRAKVISANLSYPDVGVHLKGSVGSFRPIDEKPGFTLDFSRFHARQKFHGLRRIHLNNSVEDPAYCNQELGSELFRAAGIPAPRVGHASVSLNGRKLGLYVLVEGFTEDFLSCYFRSPSGDLFEPGEGHDINQRLKRTSMAGGSRGRTALRRLASAALEPDLARRWQLLQKALDVEQFANFMALEVMLCHRDGYCLARNNFRVYHDPDTGQVVFFPHGMDQLFGIEEMPSMPHMAGLVARSFIEVPEGRDRYGIALTNLVRTLLKPDILTNRVDRLIAPLNQAVDEQEFAQIKTAASSLKQRILQRERFLGAQLLRPSPAMLEFTDEVARLAGWFKADESEGVRMEEGLGPDNIKSLRIVTQTAASPSWRTRALLAPGRYRFQGKARVIDVKPLGFGSHQGAGLRIAGQPRPEGDLVATSSWQSLSAEFEVSGTAAEIEFICELRANSGQAWFDYASLRVFRER